MNELTELIEKIHASNLYGTIVECGAGCCLTNALMSVEGASQTIYESKIPYSKQVQDKMYDTGSIRSVSKEFVWRVMEKEFLIDATFSSKSKPINFALATSFQLQGVGQSNLTHGYIAFAWKDENNDLFGSTYHISIPANFYRQYNLEIISSICIEILISKIENRLPISEYIDAVYKFYNDTRKLEQSVHETLQILSKSNNDNFIVFNPNKEIVRFEDFQRDKEGIILLKGSFNPLHERHVLMMNETKKRYPDYAAAFITSIHRYDKPDVTLQELEEKINTICGKGFYFIVNKNLFFTGTILNIRTRWKQPIICPIGEDTLWRWIDTELNEFHEWYDDYYDFNPTTEQLLKERKPWWIKKATDFKFLVFDRKGYDDHKYAYYFQNWFEVLKDIPEDDGISSTKIRNGEYKSKL